MSLQALIFDVDGTLADTEEAHRQAFNAAFADQGLDWHWSRTEYRQLLAVTGGKERLAAYLAQRVPDPQERRPWLAQVPALHALKTRHYTAAVAAGAVPLREGVADLLEEAHAAGCHLAIASTTTAANIDALLAATLGPRGLDRFSVIACGDQVRHKKPAPDIYQLALAHLGLDAAEAIAFEDSAGGLAAATAAGLWTVLTPNFWTEGAEFAAAGLVRPNLQGLRLADLEAQFMARFMAGLEERPA